MKEDFQRYFREKIVNIEEINHKGNNKLFHVTTEFRDYILKKYSIIQKDKWNRGKTEFRAISYFYKKGFSDIPRPFNFYENDNIGIYSFEQGRVLEPSEIKSKDILAAANFLTKLHNLEKEDKKRFPLERTSCLSILDYAILIENRMKNISEDFSGSKEAKHFLNYEVSPKVKGLKKSLLTKFPFKLDKKLSLEEQVITPGDFGFHNILVNSKKYTFIDFEFCGRDDPVKQILDFFHHDRTKTINKTLKDLFLHQYKEKVSLSDSFEERLFLLDPLIGMNWVLIYLNPLSKNYQKHMKFSYGNTVDINDIIKERLIKAKNKLNNLNFFKQL